MDNFNDYLSLGTLEQEPSLSQQIVAVYIEGDLSEIVSKTVVDPELHSTLGV